MSRRDLQQVMKNLPEQLLSLDLSGNRDKIADEGKCLPPLSIPATTVCLATSAIELKVAAFKKYKLKVRLVPLIKETSSILNVF